MSAPWAAQEARHGDGPVPALIAARFEDRWALLWLTLVLLICYAPVLLSRYGFLDDYTLLAEGVQGGTRVQEIAISAGRPVYAVLLFASFHSLGAIEGLVYLRLVSVVGLGLLAWRFYKALRSASWNQGEAWCLPLIIASMPAFQVYASWATTAFCPWAGLAAGYACSWAERSRSESRASRKWLAGAGAVLLLLLAITVHQAAAMIYWAFVAVAVFRTETTPLRACKQWLWYGTIGFLALALGFAAFKAGTALCGPPAGERAGVAFDPVQKLSWFVTEPLVNALGMPFLFPRRRYAWLVGIAIAGGLFCYFRGTIRDRLWLVLMALALVPLSYAPNLLVAENWASYRTISGMTALCVVFAFLALQGYARVEGGHLASRTSNAVLAAAAVACLLLASWQVYAYFARPQMAELRWVRQQLRRSDLAHASGIYLFRSPSPPWRAKRYDEFGVPSTFAEWVPKPMLYLLLRELSPAWEKLPVEHVGAESGIRPPPSAVVIDMRDLPVPVKPP